jgi:aminoglycoside phosphotransferase (APT) family kinase protein
MASPPDRVPNRVPGLDVARLDACLQRRILGLEGPMTIEAVRGGQSNPTYFLSYANRRLVLRKQPNAHILPSAHAIDREYRVMAALADSAVAVPRMVCFESDAAVVGTPFYVMERLEGRIYADCALPGLPPADRHAMYLSMCDTMARLHAVDWQAVGLADFGKPGNYFARQTARWIKQWELSRTRDNPALEAVIRWIPEHLPASDETSLVHGDFRLGNLMFHPSEPRVIGVLDWELSTLGHPLADVAFNGLAWRTLPSEYGGLRGLDLVKLGIPAEADYLQHYYRLARRTEGLGVFHYVFALFRMAVIFEGIAARAQSGTAVSEDAAGVGELALAFAARAADFIHGRENP